MRLPLPLLLLAGLAQVRAKSVFAHFMVGNTAEFTLGDWVQQMSYAKSQGIDAFALNIAYDDGVNDVALPLAFEAAESFGFYAFFSFDYAGNGAWPSETVVDLITKYGSSSGYFARGSQPLVSTFEGPGSMDDWPAIKSSTNCFFIPDWSSLGAQDAVAPGIADGLFSWDAWPKGEQNMTTYPDASYYQFMGGLPYMMPVSPWFYTNLPGYNKNWLWRGDDLWFHRWQQIISLDNAPEYVEIISWNDFGESHYIGPLDTTQYDAFDTGLAPFNYADNMPHDGWRYLLNYYIGLYKTGTAEISQEILVSWYRLNPLGSCDDGGTVGDTASQLHLEYPPNDLMTDKVYFQALLTGAADVTVSIGGATQSAAWDFLPYGGIGVYYGSVPLNGATGQVIVTVTRSGTQVLQMAGQDITTACFEGKYENYNAWVGSDLGPDISPVSPAVNLADLDCTRGTGVYEFTDICAFTCANGYCPSSACVCLGMGVAEPPEIVGVDGYPAAGQSAILLGLCSFACNHGYCPSDICSTTPNDGEVPTYSPFLPPACTGGTGSGGFEGLCSFGCNFGFCPMHACTCSTSGVLIDAPAETGLTGSYADGTEDYGLCNFAVSHGYTPDVCIASSDDDGSDPGRDETTVTLDPAVWTGSTAACEAPCILVFPPMTLGEPTVISLPPITTSLEIGWTGTDGEYTATTVTTIIVQPAVTTTEIGISNVHVTTTTSGAAPALIYPLPSVVPPPFVIQPGTYPNVPGTPVPRTINPAPWPYGTEVPTGTATATTTTTTTVVPWYEFYTSDPTPISTFPANTVSWVTNWVPEPTVLTINGIATPVIPCWVWFIWVCPPNFGGITLPGWASGIYPIGGPPAIGPAPLPPGVTLPAIPWPQITILPDLTPVYPTEPDPEEEVCESATASVCTTTLSYDLVVKRDRPAPTVTPAPDYPFGEFMNVRKRATTTATTTVSFCTQVTGCGAEDITRTTTEQSVATSWPRVVMPSDPMSVDNIRTAITQQVGIEYESKSDYLGTIFFYLGSCTDDQAEILRAVAGVADVYIPRGELTKGYYGRINIPSTGEGQGEGDHYDEDASNSTTHTLNKRGSAGYSNLIREEMLQLSWPPDNAAMGMPATGQSFYYDDSAGTGTYLYSCDFGVDIEHAELTDLGAQIQPLYPGPFPASDYLSNDPKRHGTKCIAKMAGKNLGLAKKATVSATIIDFDTFYFESFLDGLVKIYDDIYVRARGKMAVVNLSISIRAEFIPASYQGKMAYLIRQILGTGAVFVTGSGNDAGYPRGYPALFGDPANANYIQDLIVVGSVQVDGGDFPNHSVADWLTVYAPGSYLVLPDPGAGNDRYSGVGGTSFAAATVSGLAAYLRGISPDAFVTAAAVKAEILRLAYVRQRTPTYPDSNKYTRSCVWNGQRGDSAAEVGGSGSVASPPVPSSVHFTAGTPSPTCVSGSACGVSCTGYFCEDTDMTSNPDFLDPQNPDSVQNPTGPNYGDWTSTVAATGGATPAPAPTATSTVDTSSIPDCLAVYIITDSSQSGDATGTIDGVVVYKGVSAAVCSGAGWCTDFRDYSGILPPVCSAGPFECGSGYSGSATQLVSGGTLDGWFGVHFQAPDMGAAVYFEVPLTDSDVKDCADTEGSAAGDGSCAEERYGGYFGGDCSGYPLFESWTTNGLIAELSKEDALASHPLDPSVAN